MAELLLKNSNYYVRFRLHGRAYKKSLQTQDEKQALAAQNITELALHRIRTGQLLLPADANPGDFVVSGGAITSSVRKTHPSLRKLVDEFVEAQKLLVAESWHNTLQIHLRHFLAYLGSKADAPCQQVGHRHIEGYLSARLAKRSSDTVKMERATLVRFFSWAVRQDYYSISPAKDLEPIKASGDRSPFRTTAQIEAIIKRGGLESDATLKLWDTLYLTPREIGQILELARKYATTDYAHLLHAIPAYTGIRRGELLRLRWVDIDLDERSLTARSKKQSRQRLETTRHIEIHPELAIVLQKWKKKRPQGQFVVCKEDAIEPLTLDEAKYAFWQPLNNTPWCLNKAKRWYKLGFHTYRHSFASNLAAAGVDQRVIDELMGHTSESMRKRYRHLFPRLKTAAVEMLSFSTTSKNQGG